MLVLANVLALASVLAFAVALARAHVVFFFATYLGTTKYWRVCA